MKCHKFGKNSIKNMVGVHPKLIEIAFRALEISPIDFGFGVDGGHRTFQRQHELWVLKLSKCDGTMRKSEHQYGGALDPSPWVGGRSNNDPINYAKVAASFLIAANEAGVKIWWGGLWPNFEDLPHIQLDDSEYRWEASK